MHFAYTMFANTFAPVQKLENTIYGHHATIIANRCLKKIFLKGLVYFVRKAISLIFCVSLCIVCIYRNSLKAWCLFYFYHTNDALCQTFC